MDVLYPLALIFSKPILFVLFAAAHYAFWAKNTVYELCNVVAIRMDILPHQEAVVFQKVGLMGKIRNVVVPIKNLEHTTEYDDSMILLIQGLCSGTTIKARWTGIWSSRTRNLANISCSSEMEFGARRVSPIPSSSDRIIT